MHYLNNIVEAFFGNDRSVKWILLMDVLLLATGLLMLVVWSLYEQHNEGG